MQSTDTHRQYLAAFSDSYHHARNRFWQACQSLGITPTSYPHPGTGPGGEELAVDVARLGPAEASRLIILSSGLHGSEALFGSAVLLHTLHSLDPHALHTRQLAVLLLHTLNPFGAAWGRRADAENIDLNRNFLLPAETIPPPDAIARRVDQLLNPPRPPSRFPELLALRFLPLKLRYGSRAVTQAIVGGQYHNPRGLFYGGDHPSWTQQLLQTHWHRWLGPAEHILHFDFHTGLGPHAQGQMLIDQDTPPPPKLDSAAPSLSGPCGRSTPAAIPFTAGSTAGVASTPSRATTSRLPLNSAPTTVPRSSPRCKRKTEPISTAAKPTGNTPALSCSGSLYHPNPIGVSQSCSRPTRWCGPRCRRNGSIREDCCFIRNRRSVE
jgi:hypothetical protein